MLNCNRMNELSLNASDLPWNVQCGATWRLNWGGHETGTEIRIQKAAPSIWWHDKIAGSSLLHLILRRKYTEPSVLGQGQRRRRNVPGTWRESSMIHSASPHFRLAVRFTWFWSFGTDGRTEGRTDNLCENSDRYRPGMWSASWINYRWNIILVPQAAFLSVTNILFVSTDSNYWSHSGNELWT